MDEYELKILYEHKNEILAFLKDIKDLLTDLSIIGIQGINLRHKQSLQRLGRIVDQFGLVRIATTFQQLDQILEKIHSTTDEDEENISQLYSQLWNRFNYLVTWIRLFTHQFEYLIVAADLVSQSVEIKGREETTALENVLIYPLGAIITGFSADEVTHLSILFPVAYLVANEPPQLGVLEETLQTVIVTERPVPADVFKIPHSSFFQKDIPNYITNFKTGVIVNRVLVDSFKSNLRILNPTPRIQFSTTSTSYSPEFALKPLQFITLPNFLSFHDKTDEIIKEQKKLSIIRFPGRTEDLVLPYFDTIDVYNLFLLQKHYKKAWLLICPEGFFQKTIKKKSRKKTKLVLSTWFKDQNNRIQTFPIFEPIQWDLRTVLENEYEDVSDDIQGLKELCLRAISVTLLGIDWLQFDGQIKLLTKIWQEYSDQIDNLTLEELWSFVCTAKLIKVTDSLWNPVKENILARINNLAIDDVLEQEWPILLDIIANCFKRPFDKKNNSFKGIKKPTRKNRSNHNVLLYNVRQGIKGTIIKESTRQLAYHLLLNSSVKDITSDELFLSAILNEINPPSAKFYFRKEEKNRLIIRCLWALINSTETREAIILTKIGKM